MSFTELVALGGLAILAFMVVLWLVSLRLKDASIVDIFWGPGFVLAVWLYFAAAPDGYAPRKLLAAVLTTIWGLRLGGYLAWRNLGRGEDFRYRAWREAHGPKWWWHSLFKVFLLQGAVMWLISAPLALAQFSSEPAAGTALDALGAALWGIGLFFEAVGDWQLARFKADPANQGQVMDRGLWRFTRHPNYFGDALVWWGLFLLAASAPWGWLTAVSPAVMTLLLRRISGVTMLERSLSRTKPQYADYIRTTSAFFPRPPREP